MTIENPPMTMFLMTLISTFTSPGDRPLCTCAAQKQELRRVARLPLASLEPEHGHGHHGDGDGDGDGDGEPQEHLLPQPAVEVLSPPLASDFQRHFPADI